MFNDDEASHKMRYLFSDKAKQRWDSVKRNFLKYLPRR